MMKITAIVAVAATLFLPSAFARVDQDDTAKKSDLIMSKIVELDMMNFLLPLAMSKDQYSKSLPVLEKIRRYTKKSEEAEAKLLRDMEPKVDAALKDCVDKGLVPKRELRNEIATMLHNFNLVRQGIINENVDTMYTALKNVWTPTQMKIAAQSLDPKDYVPAAKAEEMQDEDKIRLFVREVMLNPAAYDVMLKLSR